MSATSRLYWTANPQRTLAHSLPIQVLVTFSGWNYLFTHWSEKHLWLLVEWHPAGVYWLKLFYEKDFTSVKVLSVFLYYYMLVGLSLRNQSRTKGEGWSTTYLLKHPVLLSLAVQSRLLCFFCFFFVFFFGSLVGGLRCI